MTIKQQGGVFGRNPTFNDVETDSLTVNTADINGGTIDGAVIGGTTPAAINGTIGQFSGNVGFGKTSPAYKVDLYSSTVDDAAVAMRIGRGGVSTSWARIDNISGVANYRQYDSSNPIIRWLNSTDGTNWTERARLDKDGNFDLKTGNLIVANGKGIDFSATAGTGTSELFDDYEEGTWTPAFSAEFTTAPTVISAQYTKVGREVSVTMLATGGVVTAGGSITGLPFASNASQGAGAYGGNSDTTESIQGTIGQSASSITNIPARTLTGDTWQITAKYFT